MPNSIDTRLAIWSEERDLIKTPEEFDVKNEATLIMEEVIELIMDVKSDEAREHAKQLVDSIYRVKGGYCHGDTSTEERINALCDIQIFAKTLYVSLVMTQVLH